MTFREYVCVILARLHAVEEQWGKAGTTSSRT